MISGKVISLQIGKPIPLMYKNKVLYSAIHKQAIQTPVFAGFEQLDGDSQVDLKHHGGLDKAICVYPYDRYSYWNEYFSKELNAGNFGENLTVECLNEEIVAIGDIYKVGEAIVQVSQPRQPCFKVAAYHQLEELPEQMRQTGYTGYYLRILEEGLIEVGNQLELLKREPTGITVKQANALMYGRDPNITEIEKLLAVPSIAPSLRKQLTKQLLLLKRE